jgi:CO/xanthine dehydrogenase Mo-binding subunit
MSDLDVVGKSHPQIDALEKTMGRTRFVSDLVLPNMLFGRILRSPYPHARIKNINTSKAEALAGVKAVATYADTPQIKFGPRTEDWTILANDKVRFAGDELAAVAAIDEDIAEEALELIEVEYEPLPYVCDPIEALKPGAPVIHDDKPDNLAAEFKLAAGDVDQAFKDSHIVYEDRYYLNQVYQAYLEPMGSIVEVDLSGKYTFYAATQIPNMMRMTYAKALGVPMDKIRIIVPDYGGAFGAKMENNVHLVAAVLAKKSGRPVKLINTRHDDFIGGNPRVPMYIHIKLGATKEGILTGKEVKIVGAGGARLIYAQFIVSTACYRVDSLYRFQHLRTVGHTAYTNTVPTSCMRGFGNAQMTFVLESSMDMIADQLKIDPVDMRLKNAFDQNEVSVHGWKIRNGDLKQCVRRAAETSNWKKKRGKKVSYKGIGVSCCNHVNGNRAFIAEFDGGGGIVRVGQDGHVLVYHGESDMGQGQKTIFAQIVAERLGVSLDMVTVAPVDTDISPFGCGSFATRGTMMGGSGVLAAATEAFNQLAEVAAEMLEANIKDIECREGKFFTRGTPEKHLPFKEVAAQATWNKHGAPVVGTGFFDPETAMPDLVTKYGDLAPAYPFACQIAEVEIDSKTGQVTVTHFYAAHDVGRAINPMAVEGQIQGGVTMGLGWTLMEDMVIKDGQLANPHFIDYLIPTAEDVPEISPILVEPIEQNGPYGAKGIGEPTLNPSMAAITNAIYNATGIRIKKLPASPAYILSEMRRK